MISRKATELVFVVAFGASMGLWMATLYFLRVDYNVHGVILLSALVAPAVAITSGLCLMDDRP